MPAFTDNPHSLCAVAHDLYQSGFSRQAADTFLKASRLAQEAEDVACMVHALRWAGNATMWAFQHDEAYPYLLQAISYDGNPEAPLEEICGAMTDLCLLSVRSRPYAALRKIIGETRDLLARRNVSEWGHRVDLLEAMGHLRRGEFALAHQLACKAWQGHLTTWSGPHYQIGAYLNIRYRAAHGCGDRKSMQDTLALFQSHGEKRIVMTRLRHNNCRGMAIAFDGLDKPADAEQLAALSLEVLGTIEATEFTRDESIEAFRLQALAGQVERAEASLHRAGLTEAADTALVRLDIEICRLGRRTGWRPAFYRPSGHQAGPPRPVRPQNSDEAARIAHLLAEADRQGRIEDQRLESTWWQQAVARRRQWLNGVAGQSSP